MSYLEKIRFVAFPDQSGGTLRIELATEYAETITAQTSVEGAICDILGALNRLQWQRSLNAKERALRDILAGAERELITAPCHGQELSDEALLAALSD